METIKQFSIPLSLNFTDSNVKNPIDLGCVYLCDVYRNLGHGNGFEAYIIINKKTMLPITLTEQHAFTFGSTKEIIPVSTELVPPIKKIIILDKIHGSNKEIPQEKYFLLRFAKESRINVYSPEGNLILFEGFDPIKSDVFCGKNIVAFSPAWSGKYLFFDPTDGKSIDVMSLIKKQFSDKKERDINVKEEDGDLSVIVTEPLDGWRNRFVVSENLELVELELIS